MFILFVCSRKFHLTFLFFQNDQQLIDTNNKLTIREKKLDEVVVK